MVPGPFGIEGMEEKVYQIGIAHQIAALPGVMGLDQERNPLVAFPRAFTMTVNHTRSLLRGLGLVGEAAIALVVSLKLVFIFSAAWTALSSFILSRSFPAIDVR